MRPIVSTNPRNLLIPRLERSRPSPTVIRRLDENFLRVRFDRLTPGEKRFLRTMASLGPGPAQSGDIADTLRLTAKSFGLARSKLIKKGMIYSRPLWRSGVHCAYVRRVYAPCHANLVNGDCPRPIGWKGSGVPWNKNRGLMADHFIASTMVDARSLPAWLSCGQMRR